MFYCATNLLNIFASYLNWFCCVEIIGHCAKRKVDTTQLSEKKNVKSLQKLTIGSQYIALTRLIWQNHRHWSVRHVVALKWQVEKITISKRKVIFWRLVSLQIRGSSQSTNTPRSNGVRIITLQSIFRPHVLRSEFKLVLCDIKTRNAAPLGRFFSNGNTLCAKI